MQRIATIAVAALVSAGPTAAQERSLDPLTDGGRYALLEINEQVVRLDTDTGAFSLCRMEGSEWTCTVTSDERRLLEEQIAALTRRVEALERGAGGQTVGALSPPPATALESTQPAAALEPAALDIQGAAPLPTPVAPTPAEKGLPPLPPAQTVADQPVPREPLAEPPATNEPVPLRSMATAESPKEKKGWLRRAAGVLPFVD